MAAVALSAPSRPLTALRERWSSTNQSRLQTSSSVEEAGAAVEGAAIEGPEAWEEWWELAGAEAARVGGAGMGASRKPARRKGSGSMDRTSARDRRYTSRPWAGGESGRGEPGAQKLVSGNEGLVQRFGRVKQQWFK